MEVAAQCCYTCQANVTVTLTVSCPSGFDPLSSEGEDKKERAKITLTVYEWQRKEGILHADNSRHFYFPGDCRARCRAPVWSRSHTGADQFPDSWGLPSSA